MSASRTFSLLMLFALSLLSPAFGITILLQNGEQFCVNKDVKFGDHFIGSYVVSGYKESSVSYTLMETSPDRMLYVAYNKKEGQWNITMSRDMELRACWRNNGNKVTYISMDFFEQSLNSEPSEVENLNKISSMLDQATENVNRIKTNLGFQKTRDHIHAGNLEYLDSQIHWSAFFKIGTLLTIGATQAYILTGFFKRQRKYVV